MLIGAQNQAMYTNGFRKMAGLSDNDRCHFCHTDMENVSHLKSGCQTLLPDGHYTNRHNKVYLKVCKEIGMETKTIQEHNLTS